MSLICVIVASGDLRTGKSKDLTVFSQSFHDIMGCWCKSLLFSQLCLWTLRGLHFFVGLIPTCAISGLKLGIFLYLLMGGCIDTVHGEKKFCLHFILN